MSDNFPPDRSVPVPRSGHTPDPHGQAAMLLVESLMHGLIAKGTISVVEAVEIIGSATDVKEELAPAMGDTPDDFYKSLILLEGIERSLLNDLQRPN